MSRSEGSTQNRRLKPRNAAHQQVPIDRDGVPSLFHFPRYFCGPDSVPSMAIIAVNLKLIKFW